MHRCGEVEGNGPPLLMVHGWGASHLWWRADGYADALKDEYQLILMDARGHGLSDKPYELEAYSQDRWLGDLLSLLGELEISSVHFCGFSMGGRYGFTLAANAPERLRSLIIMSSYPHTPEPDPDETTEHQIRLIQSEGMEALVANIEEVEGPFPPPNREVMVSNDPEAVRLQLRNLVDRPDLSGALADLQVPALVVGGTEESWDEIRHGAEILPQATLVRLEGLNHLQAGTRSDLVLPHITAFLKQVTQDQAE